MTSAGGPVPGVDVHLESDAADWDARRFQSLRQLVDGLRLRRPEPLDSVVVVEQERGRIGLDAPPERRPRCTSGPSAVKGESWRNSPPGPSAKASFTTSHWLSLPFEVRHDVGHVPDHRGVQRLARHAADPRRKLGVPDQGVAAHPHVVLRGERHQGVAGAKGELTWARLDVHPLHVVFGGERVEVRRQHLGERRLAQALRLDRRADPTRARDAPKPADIDRRRPCLSTGSPRRRTRSAGRVQPVRPRQRNGTTAPKTSPSREAPAPSRWAIRSRSSVRWAPPTGAAPHSPAARSRPRRAPVDTA